jgi:CRISPR-associated endoribonuclease Cas6
MYKEMPLHDVFEHKLKNQPIFSKTIITFATLHNIYTMRFELQLTIDKKLYGNALPFSYQYELSAYIYHTLAKGNEDYAAWLHQNGFESDGKQFRLFTFSPFFAKIAIDKTKNRLLLMDDMATLQISFLPERSTEEFVKGVFAEQQFSIGDKQSKVQFTIQHVQMMPTPPIDGELRGETLSPLCLSKKTDEGKIHFYSTAEPEAGEAIVNNLINKYNAFYGKPFEGKTAYEWETLTEPRSKLITIKADSLQQTKIKGSLCKFRLKADNELLRIGYECGLGEKGSQGFGCITANLTHS